MNILVTGGAGFIGSHLVDALCSAGNSVRVLDDLSSGFEHNLNPAATFLRGSIADSEVVSAAVGGCEVVYHLGALGSVARSVEDPRQSDVANTHGTLTMLDAAQRSGVRVVVAASSSSVYGGADIRPTPETAPLRPRSPYAVTKLAGEHYMRVFSELHGLHTVSLRFFNVFGPRQRPDSEYAAVIPRFTRAALNGDSPEVHGDGTQTRDFTFVADVVAALQAAAISDPAVTSGRAYNIAAGHSNSLLDVLEALGDITGRTVEPHFVGARAGDVRHSQADPSAALADMGWKATVSFRDGLEQGVQWMQEQL